MARLDPHSYNDTEQPEIDHFTFRARVDFDARVLNAEVALHLSAPGQGPLDLDTRDLDIREVTDAAGKPLGHRLHPPAAILGARLTVELPAGTTELRIRYRTSPSATALQWLEPAQTAGGKHPYLFSQCQAIHARSVLPIQDTPRLRMRFSAELTVPAHLRAVMAARPLARSGVGGTAVESFDMPQPIPPYLFALAVGDLTSRELGPRSRVWAEPAVVDRAAWEFAQVEEMIRAAEGLFGPYPWERFDVLLMPPSFPYGGMENPRLAFLTPTLLAGDRSLANVLAHELAHSWTGNLVSNASAEHFWLNEGFTVFAERRILEVLAGPEVSALHAALGLRGLEDALGRFSTHPELTRLRTHLADVDPDEAFSQVPYEKGYLFLRTLEEAAGREKFSAFLRDYVDAFRFRSITTEDFLGFARPRLGAELDRIDAQAWIYGEGVLANAAVPRSARLAALEATRGVPSAEEGARWTPAEWQLYLETLPRPSDASVMEGLDSRFHLNQSANYEVLVAWLAIAVASDYPPAIARVEEVLGAVGRMKYLRPLYSALIRNRNTRHSARAVFERHRQSYHPIAQAMVESLLGQLGG
jgi:leukotriene-A4 hydrolase